MGFTYTAGTGTFSVKNGARILEQSGINRTGLDLRAELYFSGMPDQANGALKITIRGASNQVLHSKVIHGQIGEIIDTGYLYVCSFRLSDSATGLDEESESDSGYSFVYGSAQNCTVELEFAGGVSDSAQVTLNIVCGGTIVIEQLLGRGNGLMRAIVPLVWSA